jgi:hypothetical protein
MLLLNVDFLVTVHDPKNLKNQSRTRLKYLEILGSGDFEI